MRNRQYHLSLFSALWLIWLVACQGRPPTTIPEQNDSPAELDAGEPAVPTDGGAMGDAGFSRPPFEPFDVSGTVVDNDFVPVAGAWVMQGGLPEGRILTDENGAFTFRLVDQGYGLAVLVATKPGYRAVGMEHFLPGEPVILKIRQIAGPDNEDYIYQEPGNGIDDMQEDCSHCHTTFVREFLTSGHAEATRSIYLQDLYAGVSRAHEDQVDCEEAGGQWKLGKTPGTEDETSMKCYLGGGVLSELNPICGNADGGLACDDPALPLEQAPTAFGACADCHAPGINGVAGGRNLHDAHGLSFEKGVHCDVCHKVSEVDLEKPPGIGRRLVLSRPSEPGKNTFLWDPVYFGPLIDVPNVAMGGSYQPQFKKAEFCAGCHEQNQPALIPGDTLDAAKWPNGLPVHSTFSEWEDGPYGQDTTPCQFCHMPAKYDMGNSSDLVTDANQSITFGFKRDPEDTRSHIFRGPLEGSPRLIDEALYVSLITEQDQNQLNVSVSVANVGCGHAVPTGEPLRSVILIVEADSESCGALIPSGGMTIPDTGGARAHGVEGQDVTTSGRLITWPQAAALVQPGHLVRVVRPTSQFDDYAGVGYFADPALTAQDKGMEIFEPVGEATVDSIDGDILHLDADLLIEAGDRLYAGDTWPAQFMDDTPSLHLAGKAGYAFSRVLTDSLGNRHVPHYKAVDMASDNRIGPGERAMTNHQFALPPGCDSGSVRATVLYRPLPVEMAHMRGWESSDYVMTKAEVTF